jgi:hypothetical protein
MENKIIQPTAEQVNDVTVGKFATDLLKKDDGYQVSAVDQATENTKDYMKNLYECVDRGIVLYPGKDFYVHVETKKEKLLENVLRNYFIPKSDCPTPNYDQAIYKYMHESGDLVFMWVVPDRGTCFYFKENWKEIPHEEKDLLTFIRMFDDGTLLKLAKRLNGEKDDSPELEKKKIII